MEMWDMSTSNFAPFPRLHSRHNARRFSSTVLPPFDHGTMWSMCSSTPESVAGERPQIVHLNLSRRRTLYLRESEIALGDAIRIGQSAGPSGTFVSMLLPKISSEELTSLLFTNSIKAPKAARQPPHLPT